MISFVWAVVTDSEEVPPYRDEVSARACCWLLDATYCKNLCRLVTSCLCHGLATIRPWSSSTLIIYQGQPASCAKRALCPHGVDFCADTKASKTEFVPVNYPVVRINGGVMHGMTMRIRLRNGGRVVPFGGI